MVGRLMRPKRYSSRLFCTRQDAQERASTASSLGLFGKLRVAGKCPISENELRALEILLGPELKELLAKSGGKPLK